MNDIIIKWCLRARDYLKEFNLKSELIDITLHLLFRYFEKVNRKPHNLKNLYASSYIITEKHPKSFPNHITMKERAIFFNMKSSSLNFYIDKITLTLSLIKWLDDHNFPYFIDPTRDIAYNICTIILEKRMEEIKINSLFHNKNPIQINSIAEDFTTTFIYEMNLFPKELYRPFFAFVLNFINNYNYKEL